MNEIYSESILKVKCIKIVRLPYSFSAAEAEEEAADAVQPF